MKFTLEEILKKQEKKISLHEELLASLENAFSNSVENAFYKSIVEFRIEVKREKENLLAELKAKIRESENYVKSLKPIKGDRGDTIVGPPGIQGDPGIDGKDSTVPGPQGEPGKDGSPDTGKEIVNKINNLPIQPELQIDYLHIKNIPKETPLFTKGRLGRGTGSPIYEYEFSLDGSTKIFTVPNSNRIVGISSTSTPFRFSLTTDYTVVQSGTSSVITFVAGIDATTYLAMGQTLFVQYIQQT